MANWSQGDRWVGLKTQLLPFREHGQERLGNGGFCLPGGYSRLIRKSFSDSSPDFFRKVAQWELDIEKLDRDLKKDKGLYYLGEQPTPFRNYLPPAYVVPAPMTGHKTQVLGIINDEKRRARTPICSTNTLFHHKYERRPPTVPAL